MSTSWRGIGPWGRAALMVVGLGLIPWLSGPACSGPAPGDGAVVEDGSGSTSLESNSESATDGTTDAPVDDVSDNPGDVTDDPSDTTTSPSITITHTIHVGSVLSGHSVQSLLGVNAGPLGTAFDTSSLDLTSLYKQMSVNLVRTHDFFGPLDMATIYPNQSADPSLESSYDFTASDTYYSAILAGGFEPYFRLGDSASAATGYPTASPRAPVNVNNWVAAAVHVVQHYNDAARWGRSPIRYVEIWNEPDAVSFWDSTRDAFVDLFGRTAVALKTAFPDLKIGGPGFTQSAYSTPVGQGWVTALLNECQAHSVPLDFLSWHTYTNNPETIVTAAQWFRSQLDAHGYTSAESHITEWNTDAISVRSTSLDEALALRTGARGAAVVTGTWIRLQEQGVQLSTFYRGRDPQFDHAEFYGLLSGAGQMKKSGLAFVLWSRLASGYPTRLDVSAETSSSATLYCLAGRSSDGGVAVLLANPSDQTLGCQLYGYTRTVNLWQVSDAANATEHTAVTPNGFAVPAYSVQLVIIAP